MVDANAISVEQDSCSDEVSPLSLMLSGRLVIGMSNRRRCLFCSYSL